jgi:uncharacterized RDD family membrane protein YckC
VSDDAPGLVVGTNTGIEVSLPVAGPGVRSYAFLVDWHVRVILALAWYVAGAVLYNGTMSLAPPLATNAVWFGAVALPTLAIYFLYHPVIEVALRGSTPGKRMAGVRVVSRHGGAASAGALLVRNVFRVIDALPAFYGVGLVVALVSRDNLRWGDMAAGTVLVYQRTQGLLPLETFKRRSGALEAQGAELVFELLERWSTLEPQARVTLARQLLVRHGADAGAVSNSGEHELHSLLEGLSNPT